jgi:hypothetical protein
MKLNKRIIKAIGLLMFGYLGLFSIPVHAQQKDNLSKVFVEKAVQDSLIGITTDDNKVTLSNVPVNTTMEIYTIIGTKVKEIEIKQPSGEYILKLPKGYYIIRIADTVRKIVIR